MRSPAQFLAARNNRCAELEARIDKAIDASAFFNQTSVSVPVHGYPQDVIDAVMADYRRAGWIASFSASTRGEYIHLEVQP